MSEGQFVGSEVEIRAPSESEGKKWAEIIRKEGSGILRGKFYKSWTFVNPDGQEEQVTDKEGPFSGRGEFGNTYLLIPSDSTRDAKSRYVKVINEYDLDDERKYGRVFNSLIVGDINKETLEEKNIKERYTLFEYTSRLANAPDARTSLIGLDFCFALPLDRASELLVQIKQKPDLIEEVFQSVYPGFTGKMKAERVKVSELNIVEVSSSGVGNKTSKLPFSESVGEI